MAFAQGVLTLPVAWAVCVDIAHRYGGTATGFMNTERFVGDLADHCRVAGREVRLL